MSSLSCFAAVAVDDALFLACLGAYHYAFRFGAPTPTEQVTSSHGVIMGKDTRVSPPNFLEEQDSNSMEKDEWYLGVANLLVDGSLTVGPQAFWVMSAHFSTTTQGESKRQVLNVE